MNTKRKIVEKNTNGRDFVVGDLHGCYDHLLTLLEFVGFDKEKDRLFSVGDLIDRGTKSMECLSLIYEPWFHTVRGNHEQMMIDYYYGTDTYDTGIWVANGGSWKIDYDVQLMKASALDLIKLPYVITIDGVCNIVHSQLPVNRDGTINQSDLDEWNYHEYELDCMLWNRQLMEARQSYDFPILPTICGHTAVEQVRCKSNHIDIDTGIVYGGKLSLLEIPEDFKNVKIHAYHIQNDNCITKYYTF